jgi:hypothetical protein
MGSHQPVRLAALILGRDALFVQTVSPKRVRVTLTQHQHGGIEVKSEIHATN